MLMMSYGNKPIRVHQNGVDVLDGTYYTPELSGYVGEYVIVKYSLSDISKVVIVNMSGRKVCQAFRKEKVHAMAYHMGTPRDQEELRRQQKAKAQMIKETKSRTKAVMLRHGILGNNATERLLGQSAVFSLQSTAEEVTVDDKPLLLYECDRDED